MTETKAWAVKGPTGKILVETVAANKRITANSMVLMGNWYRWDEQGYRVVRVRIIEDTND